MRPKVSGRGLPQNRGLWYHEGPPPAQHLRRDTGMTKAQSVVKGGPAFWYPGSLTLGH